MKAMILAAGYGTRLQPVTYALPKPLVPLAGRPLIGWAVESLLAAGIRDIVVNLHYLPELIERHLRERYADARFEFSYEPDILGTGGGVRKARPLLEPDTVFLLLNGDTIQFPPYDAMLAARIRGDALAVLALRHPPQGDHFTPVYLEDDRVTGFGKGTGAALMFSGAHLIASRIFDDLPNRDFFGIVDEVYQPLIERGEPIAGVVDDGLWFDIGTPRRYVNASHTLLDLMTRGQLAIPVDSQIAGDSLVHRTALVTSELSRSIVGSRSVIEGALRDTVVWDDCRIAPGVVLDNCVVANGVEIAGSAVLRGVMICRDDPAVPREGAYRFENGLVLRDL